MEAHLHMRQKNCFALTALRHRVVAAALVIGLTSGAASAVQDCNNNGVSDGQDITSGFSNDANSNGVPDECEPQATLVEQDFDGIGGSSYSILGSSLLTSGAVRLTDSVPSTRGQILFDDEIPLGMGGIQIDFDYLAGGGSGADGLLLAIVDAAAHPPGAHWETSQGWKVRMMWDEYKNPWDPDANHVDIGCFSLPPEEAWFPMTAKIDDYTWQHASVRFTNSGEFALTVRPASGQFENLISSYVS